MTSFKMVVIGTVNDDLFLLVLIGTVNEDFFWSLSELLMMTSFFGPHRNC